MKILIIYDSLYGNTEKIAKEIAAGLKKSHRVTLIAASQIQHLDLQDSNLLIVGSPTHGGRPKTDLQNILDQIPAGTLSNIHVAAFDTRFDETKQNVFLKLLMKIIGYAAPKIASLLEHKGGISIVPPEGFFVNGKNGPLQKGEIERSGVWAKQIISSSH